MEATKKIVVIGSMAWAVVLSSVALMLPPQGVIDSSVLILIAQVLVLVATILGFHLYPIIKNDNQANS